MNRLAEIMAQNKDFVENKQYESMLTSKYPDKKLVIVTCMDTRLVELLPKALRIRNGDVKMIKTAGALIHHPYDSVMRSVIVAVTMLKAEEVLVIGHLDCGMAGLKGEQVVDRLKDRGVALEELNGQDVNNWLSGCEVIEQGVLNTVKLIKEHPLLPKDVKVHGLTIDPTTGQLALLYEDQ